MPEASELPASLEKLARIQAIELSPHRFNSDAGRVVAATDAALAAAAARRAAESRAAKSSAVVTRGGDRLAVGDPWGNGDIGPHNRGWLITAFLLPFSVTGAVLLPLLLFKRDRALLLNVILAVELVLVAGPGIACGFIGSRFVSEHASAMISASFWAAAVVLAAPSAVALCYCLIRVGQYRQPEIRWFTRSARRIAAALGPVPPAA